MASGGSRKHKLGSSLRGGLSRVIQTEMNDPRLGFVTVTSVDVHPDLRLAKVFVSIMGDEDVRGATLSALHQARGFLRHRLGTLLALRRIPELRFQLDTSADTGERMDRLLHELEAERETIPGADDEEPIVESPDEPEDDRH